MRLFRLLGHPGCAFLLGIVSVFLLGMISSECDPADPAKVVHRWGILETSPGCLRIPVPADQLTVLEIESESRPLALRSVKLLRSDCGSVFKYQTRGPSNSPVAIYGGGGSDPSSWVTWTDLDANGCFDERTDPGAREFAIRTEDGWLLAVMEDDFALTLEGRYQFEPDLGQWRRVKDAP